VLNRSAATIVFAAVLAVASSSPTMAAKHAKAIKIKLTGACAQQSGRRISDCDQLNWCTMNTCVNGQSTPAVLALLPAKRLVPRPALLNRDCWASSMPACGVACDCAGDGHRHEMARDDHTLPLGQRRSHGYRVAFGKRP
jgi:hypothetical protein